MTPKARHAKNKARITSYENLLNQDTDEKQKDLSIYIPPGPRLGNIVIEANNISKSFGDKLLYNDLTFQLPAGGIVGIIGANGTGKTTLFKMISDLEKPDSGTFKVGETATVGYMSQSRLDLDGNKTVYELISEGSEVIQLGKREINARAYCGKFNFAGQDQQAKVNLVVVNEIESNSHCFVSQEPTYCYLTNLPTISTLQQ